MAIAFSTLVVFVLLLPGLFAVLGIYKSDNLSRDLLPPGILPQLAIFVIASVLIHGLLIGITNGLLCPCLRIPSVNLEYVLGFATLGSDKGIAAKILAENLTEFFPWILLYFVIAMGMGFLGGFGFGKLILNGPLRFVATHGWLYDVFGRDHKQPGYVFAYVLSEVTNETKRVIYYGAVKKCQYSSEGALAYVVLDSPRRGLMTIGDTLQTTGSDGKQNWQFLEPSGRGQSIAPKKGSNLLYIDGKNIQNIFFASQPWALQTSSVPDLEKLAEAIRAAAQKLHEQKKQLRQDADVRRDPADPRGSVQKK